MNKKDRAILYGLAIGDGHISHRNRLKDNKYAYVSAELIIGHGDKQKNYIEHKADLVHKIFGGNRPKVAKVSHTLKTTGKTYCGWRIAKTNKYFRQMHKTLYKENKQKKITEQVLSYLDEHSLALWFMDDGSIGHNKNRDGVITSVDFKISTHCTKEEAELISKWLSEKWKIETKLYLSKGSWCIRGNTQATVMLVNTIFSYLENSMFYKIKPVAQLTIHKSAKHPHFSVDDDIVRSVQNKMGSEEDKTSSVT